MPYIGPPLQETFAQLLATDDRTRRRGDCPLPRSLRRRGHVRELCLSGHRRHAGGAQGGGDASLRGDFKPYVFAVKILEHFDLAHYFDGVYGSETDGRLSDKGRFDRRSSARRGLDQPRRSWWATARTTSSAAGVPACARRRLSTATRAELDAHAPDFIFPSPAALLAVVMEEQPVDHSELLAAWQREETAPFSGWFAYLAGRMVEG